MNRLNPILDLDFIKNEHNCMEYTSLLMKRPIIWHDLCPKFGGPMHLEKEIREQLSHS